MVDDGAMATRPLHDHRAGGTGRPAEADRGPGGPGSGRRWSALVGVAAGATTLGVAELLAAVLARLLGSSGTPSPLLAVGAAFVDRTPAWLKDWAVAAFETADKVALGVGMALVLLVACAAVGVLAVRSRPVALGLFGLLGLVGVASVLSRPASGPLEAVPTVAGVLVGMWVLGELLDRSARAGAEETGPSRRALLRATGGLTVLGLVGVVAGQALGAAGRVAEQAVRALRLPVPVRTASVPDGASSDLAGHSAYLTPNDEFFRIDTALRVPRVDPETWRLRVTGLVEREVEIGWDELMAEPHVEALVTLTCVSNQVGGDLVGNARWQGWPVRELLARAGVRPEADMVLSRSADGWTAGTPIEVLTDDRDALLAVAMNGEPLPPQHGFPVRMVVPGLYGYVSATKWVTELKVTRFDADEGYWTPRGWSARGPVKTASRIDTPRDGDRLPAAEIVLGGVAWAQHRGVQAVEVQVDDGPWSPAELLAEPTVDAWRLWRWAWADPTPGSHTLRVRATDGTGEVQTSQPAPPAPDGSSGWHTITVRVG